MILILELIAQYNDSTTDAKRRLSRIGQPLLLRNQELQAQPFEFFMLFRSMRRCESGFSSLLGTKNKARNKRIIEQDLWFALTARAGQNKIPHIVVLWMSDSINEFYLTE